MALANAAAQLANKHGLRVIVIDWDLEAPGLHYYFGITDQQLTTQQGLIDYLEDFKNQVSLGERGVIPDVTQYLTPLTPKTAEKLKFGSIRLFTCGRMDETYAKRVREFSWEDFYALYSGFRIVESLKKSLRDQADVILIDARSGQSESGATPTVQMPDGVILLFTSNRQNLEGTAKIARFLKNHSMRVAQEFPELRLLFVPSRVFPGTDRYERWVHDEAAPIYSELLAEGIANRRDQPRGLYQCVLVIDPAATVGESLIVLEPEEVHSSLRSAYEDLATAIDDFRAGRSLWSTPAEHDKETGFPEQEHREALRGLEWDEVPEAAYSDLDAAIKRGDHHQIARLSYQLGVGELRKRDFNKAEELLRRALDYYAKENEAFATIVTIWLARVYRDKGRPADGWNLLQPALSTAEKAGDADLLHAVRMELAAVRRAERKYQEAFEIIERLLNDAEKRKNVAEQAFYLHTLGHLREDERRLTEAGALFERSLALAQRVHSIHSQVENYFCLGNVRRNEKQPAAAAELYQTALVLLEGIREHRVIRTKLLLALGEIREDQNDFEAARNAYARALSDAERSADIAGRVMSLRHLARLEGRQGRLEQAYDRYEEALAIAEGNSHDLQCGPLHSMAHLRQRQGRESESELLFKRSLSIAEDAGDIAWQLENRICLADLFRSQNKIEKARPLYEEALALADSADDERRRRLIRTRLSELRRLHKER
jgi:tetratricopeptide (TPR) repeat protein